MTTSACGLPAALAGVRNRCAGYADRMLLTPARRRWQEAWLLVTGVKTAAKTAAWPGETLSVPDLL